MPRLHCALAFGILSLFWLARPCSRRIFPPVTPGRKGHADLRRRRDLRALRIPEGRQARRLRHRHDRPVEQEARRRAKPMNMEFKGLIVALQGGRLDIINSAMYINDQRAEPGRLRSLSEDRHPGHRAGGQSGEDHRPRRLAVRQDRRRHARRHSGDLRAARTTSAARDKGLAGITVMTMPTAQDSALTRAAGPRRRLLQLHAGRGRADGQGAGRLRRGGPGVRNHHADRHGGAQGRHAR